MCNIYLSSTTVKTPYKPNPARHIFWWNEPLADSLLQTNQNNKPKRHGQNVHFLSPALYFLSLRGFFQHREYPFQHLSIPFSVWLEGGEQEKLWMQGDLTTNSDIIN
jgi:hypothetical protein